MKKLRIVVLILAVVIIGGAAFVKFVIFRKSDPSVASKKPDIEIASGALVKNFEMDENSSNSKYLNKILLVTGRVDNITANKDEVTIYLKDKDQTSGVMCSFTKGQIPGDAVVVGNTVKIKGICNGYLMDVVLNRCSLENK